MSFLFNLFIADRNSPYMTHQSKITLIKEGFRHCTSKQVAAIHHMGQMQLTWGQLKNSPRSFSLIKCFSSLQSQLQELQKEFLQNLFDPCSEKPLSFSTDGHIWEGQIITFSTQITHLLFTFAFKDKIGRHLFFKKPEFLQLYRKK